MLLCVDIGNTSIVIGIYKGDELLFSSRISTDRKRIADQYAVELLGIFRLNSLQLTDFSGAIVSSVVPELNNVFSSAIMKLTGRKPMFVGPGTKTGLKILINNPNQLGADMVAGAVQTIAAYSLPCLVADLGTATKLYVIDENSAFLGCTIAAGVEISLNALSGGTSQLPSISIEAPKSAIGKNSVESMQSGAVFGTAAMLDGIVERIENELGCPFASLVATGGYSQDIISFCKKEFIHDELLILNGLKLIYEKNSK